MKYMNAENRPKGEQQPEQTADLAAARSSTRPHSHAAGLSRFDDPAVFREPMGRIAWSRGIIIGFCHGRRL
jgi:hypothetical protein